MQLDGVLHHQIVCLLQRVGIGLHPLHNGPFLVVGHGDADLLHLVRRRLLLVRLALVQDENPIPEKRGEGGLNWGTR